jgi:hypothetical protein
MLVGGPPLVTIVLGDNSSRLAGDARERKVKLGDAGKVVAETRRGCYGAGGVQPRGGTAISTM